MAEDAVVSPGISAQGGSSQTGQITLGPGQRKLSKSEAGFRENGGVPGLRCGDCSFFQGGTCQVVEGPIGPDDVSDQFEPALQLGNMTADTLTGPLAGYSMRGLTMFITRVSRDQQGRRRWHATASGTKQDLYGEQMSIPLFRDFLARIEKGEAVPEPFSSAAWRGGMPYVSVAHYLDQDGAGIVGMTERLWIDGDILKARGFFNDTPLGIASFNAIKRDLDERRPDNERVRISIAFIDYGHMHKSIGEFVRESLTDRCQYCESGAGEKEYRRGQLVHMALTRRPAYPETKIELEVRAMSASTRKEDAASIVGSEMAEELEKRAKALTERSAGIDPGVIVLKQDEPGGGPGTAADLPLATGTAEVPEPGSVVHAPSNEPAYLSIPLHGATTLAAAEEYVKKNAPGAIVSSWDLLVGVLGNIVGADKVTAVRAAVQEFQKGVDQQTASALLDVKQFIVNQGGSAMTPEPSKEPAKEAAPVAASEPAPAAVASAKVHPLDGSLAALRSAFDEAAAAPADRETKLKMIQPAINKVAQDIQTFVAPAPQASGMNAEQLAALVRDSVNGALAPFAPALQALMAGGSVERGVGAGGSVRRAYRPDTPTIPLGGGGEAKPNSIRALSRRSVGLRD